jgi:uncharacterized protein YegL
MNQGLLNNIMKGALTGNSPPGTPVDAADAGRTRFPVLFLVDVSGSTGEGPNPDLPQIERMLNALINQLRQPANINPLKSAVADVDVAIVTYSEIPTLVQPWEFACDLPPVPKLEPLSGTNTGTALIAAIDYVERRKRDYAKHAVPIPYAVPHIFHLTDGSPTDMKMGDAKWVKVQSLLMDISGDRKDPYQAISHLISPNGMIEGHTGMKDENGQPISGYKALSLWTGGDSVFELMDSEDKFEGLVTVIMKTLTGHTRHAARIHDLLKEQNGKTIRNPHSVLPHQPAPKKTGTDG